MSEVRLETSDGVARVTIDRPRSLNAIAARTAEELREIWDELERDRSVRVVVLTGAGDRAFCVGADMGGEDDDEPGDLEYWSQPRPDGFGGIALRTGLDVPLIARVNGYALGGGMEMLLGCDIAIASSTAQLGLPEPRVGRLPLDGGMSLLPRRVPRAWAMELLLTGKRISAEDAMRMGIVNEVVPPEELDAAVDRVVEEILACAPTSIRAIKQFVSRTRHLSAIEAQATLVPALAEAFASGEGDEGVRAFQEKRPPAWAPRDNSSEDDDKKKRRD